MLKSPSGKNSCHTPFLIRPFPDLKTQKPASPLGDSDLHGNVRSPLMLAQGGVPLEDSHRQGSACPEQITLCRNAAGAALRQICLLWPDSDVVFFSVLAFTFSLLPLFFFFLASSFVCEVGVYSPTKS